MNSGTSSISACHAEAKAMRSARPNGLAHRLHGDVHRFHRPDQPDATFDLAIVEHDAGGRICTAARPDRSMSSFAHGSSSSASAASSVTGWLRLRSVRVRSRVSAPVPGWV
ncbi:MAG: hypothetical protein R3D80_13700 [Paracoccaceae bacterium]